jgi:hypothetical protein
MHDEFVLADSAGHTMIDIEAARAADREGAGAAEPREEKQGATDD